MIYKRGEQMSDLIFIVLAFGFVLYVSGWYLKNAIPVYRQFRKQGVRVNARVTGFEATKLGIKNSDKFFVDIAAVPPGESSEKSYKLSTCHHRGKRYSKITDCKVIFGEGDPVPVLEEEIKLWRGDIILSFIGVFLSLLMITGNIWAAVTR